MLDIRRLLQETGQGQDELGGVDSALSLLSEADDLESPAQLVAADQPASVQQPQRLLKLLIESEVDLQLGPNNVLHLLCQDTQHSLALLGGAGDRLLPECRPVGGAENQHGKYTAFNMFNVLNIIHTSDEGDSALRGSWFLAVAALRSRYGRPADEEAAISARRSAPPPPAPRRRPLRSVAWAQAPREIGEGVTAWQFRPIRRSRSPR